MRLSARGRGHDAGRGRLWEAWVLLEQASEEREPSWGAPHQALEEGAGLGRLSQWPEQWGCSPSRVQQASVGAGLPVVLRPGRGPHSSLARSLLMGSPLGREQAGPGPCHSHRPWDMPNRNL